MKRLLFLLVAMGLFGAMPVFAGHDDMNVKHGDLSQCSLQSESIQEKIKRLESEVAKGEKKYDAKQLKKLKTKLDEANKILDQLNKN